MSDRARADFRRRFRMAYLAAEGIIRKAQCRLALQLSIFANMPRPQYCECCRLYGWCTQEMAAYSTSLGFLCEECAEANEKETEHAWRSFYGY